MQHAEPPTSAMKRLRVPINHYYAGQPEFLAIATRITRDFVENRGLLDI
jgi:hypothetical protein